MDVSHEAFVSRSAPLRRVGCGHRGAACERVIEGEVELTPGQLAELVHLHGLGANSTVALFSQEKSSSDRPGVDAFRAFKAA